MIRPVSCMLSMLWLSSCATQQVSYNKDIQPIFNQKCSACHSPPSGNGYLATGLKLDSYENLMKGTVYGPVVYPGDSRRSILNMLVEGRAGKLENSLHETGQTLHDSDSSLLREWVNQGAVNN